MKYCSKLFSGSKVLAFTLAEVLITLGIIGIVAAMTLPTVINNSRNKQLEAALKKNYSVLSQVLDMYQAETGERFQPLNTGVDLKKILLKYLHIIKDCGNGIGDADKACIPNFGDVRPDHPEAEIYKNFTGERNIDLTIVDDGQFVVNDSSLWLMNATGAYISIDINGYNKNPNRFGHDLFMFQIDDNGKLLPMGAEGTTYFGTNYCSSKPTNVQNGFSCTYKALTEKDYFKNLPK